MTNIIALFSAIFLIYEIGIFIKPLEYDLKLRRISDNIKSSYIDPTDRPFMIFNLVYFLWSVIGMFTKFWPMFISIVIVGLISSKQSKNVIGERERIRMRRIDSSFSIFFLITILYFYFN